MEDEGIWDNPFIIKSFKCVQRGKQIQNSIKYSHSHSAILFSSLLLFPLLFGILPEFLGALPEFFRLLLDGFRCRRLRMVLRLDGLTCVLKSFA
jgi:hypothetical protein